MLVLIWVRWFSSCHRRVWLTCLWSACISLGQAFREKRCVGIREDV